MGNKNKIIAVVGPTGSGKTSLAVALAKEFNGVLISADSRQIYLGLNIGTNKEGVPSSWLGFPTRVIDNIPQLLVDVAKPGSRYTLAEWLNEAQNILTVSWRRGKQPIIVGGTGLYVSALLDGYMPGQGRYSTRRVKVSFSSLVLEVNTLNREELYQKSDQRCLKIFADLCAETNKLLELGTPRDWLNGIGLDYRYANEYLEQKINRETAISSLQIATRRYIRRQQTWWKHHGTPVPILSYQSAHDEVANFLLNS